jgi:hypothetical protein
MCLCRGFCSPTRATGLRLTARCTPPHDGAAHWRKIDLGGFVTELATANENAYAIVSNASGTQNKLMRSPAAHDDWVRLPAAGNVDGGLTARAGHVLVQSASGRAAALTR